MAVHLRNSFQNITESVIVSAFKIKAYVKLTDFHTGFFIKRCVDDFI
jgi:hypothetical protein